MPPPQTRPLRPPAGPTTDRVTRSTTKRIEEKLAKNKKHNKVTKLPRGQAKFTKNLELQLQRLAEMTSNAFYGNLLTTRIHNLGSYNENGISNVLSHHAPGFAAANLNGRLGNELTFNTPIPGFINTAEVPSQIGHQTQNSVAMSSNIPLNNELILRRQSHDDLNMSLQAQSGNLAPQNIYFGTPTPQNMHGMPASLSSLSSNWTPQYNYLRNAHGFQVHSSHHAAISASVFNSHKVPEPQGSFRMHPYNHRLSLTSNASVSSVTRFTPEPPLWPVPLNNTVLPLIEDSRPSEISRDRSHRKKTPRGLLRAEYHSKLLKISGVPKNLLKHRNSTGLKAEYNAPFLKVVGLPKGFLKSLKSTAVKSKRQTTVAQHSGRSKPLGTENHTEVVKHPRKSSTVRAGHYVRVINNPNRSTKVRAEYHANVFRVFGLPKGFLKWDKFSARRIRGKPFPFPFEHRYNYPLLSNYFDHLKNIRLGTSSGVIDQENGLFENFNARPQMYDIFLTPGSTAGPLPGYELRPAPFRLSKPRRVTNRQSSKKNRRKNIIFGPTYKNNDDYSMLNIDIPMSPLRRSTNPIFSKEKVSSTAEQEAFKLYSKDIQNNDVIGHADFFRADNTYNHKQWLELGDEQKARWLALAKKENDNNINGAQENNRGVVLFGPRIIELEDDVNQERIDETNNEVVMATSNNLSKEENTETEAIGWDNFFDLDAYENDV